MLSFLFINLIFFCRAFIKNALLYPAANQGKIKNKPFANKVTPLLAIYLLKKRALRKQTSWFPRRRSGPKGRKSRNDWKFQRSSIRQGEQAQSAHHLVLSADRAPFHTHNVFFPRSHTRSRRHQPKHQSMSAARRTTATRGRSPLFRSAISPILN